MLLLLGQAKAKLPILELQQAGGMLNPLDLCQCEWSRPLALSKL